MSNIKLQVGKTYRSRNGEEVKITGFAEGIQYPYKGDNGKWYAESGQWAILSASPYDLIEEVPSETTRHTFAIPDGVKEVTIEQVGNRIVLEMLPEEKKEPKPGDVMINNRGSIYIFKRDIGYHRHESYAWLGKDGGIENLFFTGWCLSGRPATFEEAKPLFDALKKAGKRWNSETMQVEDIPESDCIREWVEKHCNCRYYSHDGLTKVIYNYLKHKEGENER